MIRKIPPETKTFHFYNANPKNRRTGDCVVRALSLALEQSWEDTLTGLFHVSLKVKSVPNSDDTYPAYLKEQGWIQMKQPRKKDGKKYTVGEWVKANEDKTMVISMANHCVCAKGGKVWDIWDCTGKSVCKYWVKGE